ncbi:hypothetical protein Cgig2_020574 [Carnegiea gigantea]|uniref:Uncharacterized protein n=1 Tax=Carnegiea gigantea TaxID=171969 RepID=A0A9Q1Q927_9CARY|nr:hypothetical protein Cgig2_020574 [Carnegiea gigantea]
MSLIWKLQVTSLEVIFKHSTRSVWFGTFKKWRSVAIVVVMDLRDSKRAKQGDRGYTSGSPPSSRPSSLDAPASASKGLVASSSAASPSDEGEIKATSSESRSSAAARSHSSTKRGCPSGLAYSSAPWLGLHRLRPSPTGAATLSFRLRGPLASLISRDESLQPPALCRWPLPLLRRHRPWSSPLQISLGGPKPQGSPGPRILTISWTRESLVLTSALIKLAKGHGTSEEVPLAPGVVAAAPQEGVRCTCWARVRSPVDRLPN